MTKGVYIVGTDTEIGKTLITGALAYTLCKDGYNTVYFKAALSGAEMEDGKMIPGDTKFVCSLAGIQEKYEYITPYIYKTAVSPYLASKLENNPIDIKIIEDRVNDLKKKYDYIICEGSGGVTCPLTDFDGKIYTLDNLIKKLDMNVILVATAGLGTINHTVLTAKYMEDMGICIKGIVINGYKDTVMCNDNIDMIKGMTGIPILGIMPSIEKNTWDFMESIKKVSEKVFNSKGIIDCMKEI
ncbi:dethiobiotin synthase [Clostridium tyrobutyricum]|jgi:dethiobiotin synthetase|uniref:ATP-dependent dethiobiotin synthetase BioD n=1 Tax=Clostridium tyrobutyricum TaxID=1519 RepID=A0A0A7HIU9_CLOTY|nr:dethiobiotin synthase [Clostridium tyrobutyricum]AIZ03746.1 dithiobiotin synthetase [Clostridium tyrobutyricum]MBR9647484.1 dethiobiotin synthase [Clostridium tyrobutyricum]MBV4414747.1 dethiobiotin synthase [Clostridium tyrobutyricum]MBV4422352.1 dethiobiotin synthase [Clostridium tyrobutyricum]MBV4425253.1 dethiobiotin synthase [Clostridium tyrobutyricum]